MRKKILLTIFGVLLIIYVVQLVNAAKKTTKDLTLKDTPDSITIKKGNNTIRLSKKDNVWLIGDKKYIADESDSSDIENAVKTIKVLDTVSHSNDSAVSERYELNADKAMTITASKNGKVLRKITAGKVNSTGSHTYVRVDDSKDVYLVSGSYKNIFDKTESDLRSKKVYKLDKDSITDVKITAQGISWEIAKTGKPEEWKLVSVSDPSQKITIDPDHTKTWVSSISHADASSWATETTVVPNRDPDAVVTIQDKNNKTVTMNVFRSENADTTDKNTKVDDYLCTCSASPYKFYVSSYMGEIFNKKLSDLKK